MARGQGPFTCSFCGKNQEQTQRLIAGPNRVYICGECVAVCNLLLAEGGPAPSQQTNEEVRATPPPPRSPWRRLTSRSDR